MGIRLDWTGVDWTGLGWGDYRNRNDNAPKAKLDPSTRLQTMILITFPCFPLSSKSSLRLYSLVFPYRDHLSI